MASAATSHLNRLLLERLLDDCRDVAEQIYTIAWVEGVSIRPIDVDDRPHVLIGLSVADLVGGVAVEVHPGSPRSEILGTVLSALVVAGIKARANGARQ
ncbi:hypothetical protein [Paludisphaera rhizosphaerae]|uniref:hypothetical protein n=1 Tax=Paludisphaera rhizosphaerae TaxID=2711216 RepID=UPI0013ED1901|nr:hypothetical protein [Paludisphaera rhizosphaerae]